MTTDKFNQSKRPAAVSIGISILLHLVVFIIALPRIDLAQPPEPTEKEREAKEFTVETISEDDLDPVVRETLTKRIEELREIEKPPEPEPEPEKKKELKPPDLTPDNRKAVVQETNAEKPTDANYLSENFNKVEEETRAKETTDNATPGRDESTEEAAKKREEQLPTPEMKRQEAKVKQEAQDHEHHDHDHENEPHNPYSPIVRERKVDPKTLMQPNLADYNQVFGARDQKARARVEAQEGIDAPKILRGYERNNKILKAAMENFITEIKPGNHTGVNAHRNVYATYIAKIHSRIHRRWADGFLIFLDTSEPAGSPLQDPRLTTKLELVIKADTGVVETINIVDSSGEVRFDAEAISIVSSVGRHPNPPPEIVSPNGYVYVHWQFWRDQRQCGTFGASVFLLNVDEG